METNPSNRIDELENSAMDDTLPEIIILSEKDIESSGTFVDKIAGTDDCSLKNQETSYSGTETIERSDSKCENDESLMTIQTMIVEEDIIKEEEIIKKGEVDNSENTENIECVKISEAISSVEQEKPEVRSNNAENTNELTTKGKITSLASIALAYGILDSDSDDSCCDLEENTSEKEACDSEIKITKEYRNKPIVETSDEESKEDSSTEEESSSSEVESDASEPTNGNCKKGNRRKTGQEREIKGEYDDLPPIEELKISVPEVLCDPLGEVGWMVEQMVVVKPKAGKPTLNLDTILFIERGRRVLGRIFDVFGQVSEPHYCVRFNSSDHIKQSDIRVGMIVYFCPNTEYTSVVFLHDLLKMKATEEMADDEHPEFSDDEEERAYYATLKQKQKTNNTKNSEVPQKRQRTDNQDSRWRSNHPWSSGKKQQPTKCSKTYKKPEWSDNQQQSGCHQANFWQYPMGYNQWPNSNNYRNPDWQPTHNLHAYNEQFTDHSRQENPRPFFRLDQTFSSHDPQLQNRTYQTSHPRIPNVNYPWRAQTPRLPGFSWPLPPPPPPPPGI